MNFRQYEEKITTAVATLSHAEKVALCLMCCNRLYPVYDTFHKIEGWGNPARLAECHHVAKDWLNGSEVEPGVLRAGLEQVIPDTEDFGSIYGSYALNASASHAYLLDLIIQDKAVLLGYVLHHCYSTMDSYVQELLDPVCKGGVSEVAIDNHPAMIAELTWQLDTINTVRGNKKLIDLVHQIKAKPIFNII